MKVISVTDSNEKRAVARAILEDLPEWFSIPESTEEYIHESTKMPFFAAVEVGEAVGFMAMKETSAYTAEIYVCGVKKRCHRCGTGRAMFAALCGHAREQGYEYLQVKTVAAGYYAEYDATRMFYERMGFRALEVFPTLWDKNNPCLVMVMRL
ncbi:MAG: GNAT family N-acetyltransferase [Clostridia bacterium]|nr:GNAT family N-acetyltransferase [Clostridia bacterium]